MDFFKLLKTKTEVKTDSIKCEKNHNENTFDLEQVQFRKGENVRIIYLKNSDLNYYKGYNGIIRESIASNDYCMVILEALNSSYPIKFPKSHFIKWCPYTNIEL